MHEFLWRPVSSVIVDVVLGHMSKGSLRNPATYLHVTIRMADRHNEASSNAPLMQEFGPAGQITSRVMNLMQQYQDMGADTSRIIFRIPATWEGIAAAKDLEGRGIATHLILINRCTHTRLHCRRRCGFLGVYRRGRGRESLVSKGAEPGPKWQCVTCSSCADFNLVVAQQAFGGCEWS